MPLCVVPSLNDLYTSSQVFLENPVGSLAVLFSTLVVKKFFYKQLLSSCLMFFISFVFCTLVVVVINLVYCM